MKALSHSRERRSVTRKEYGPEMIEWLQSQWHQDMPFDAIVKLRDEGTSCSRRTTTGRISYAVVFGKK
jgi:hypothetical protein